MKIYISNILRVSHMSKLKKFGIGTTSVFASLGVYVKLKRDRDEGFRRALRLYSVAGPVVLAYRTTEFRHKYAFLSPKTQEARDKEWSDLDEKYSGVIVDLLNELQGMYTKYGQTGAGLTNTFSPVWIEKLRTLEDGCTPKGREVVERTILEETGKSIDEIFESFDPIPLGSASIGQVHRATLRSDGSEVAVKVQYPEAQRLFRNDMETIRGFFRVFAPEQLIIMDELKRSFEREFDYRMEAKNLKMISGNLERAGLVPSEAVVPLPREELCTRRLLVMDLLRGPKLVDGLRSYIGVLAKKEGITAEEFETRERERIEREGIPERYDGPSANQIAAYLRYMRIRDATANVFVYV